MLLLLLCMILACTSLAFSPMGVPQSAVRLLLDLFASTMCVKATVWRTVAKSGRQKWPQETMEGALVVVQCVRTNISASFLTDSDVRGVKCIRRN